MWKFVSRLICTHKPHTLTRRGQKFFTQTKRLGHSVLNQGTVIKKKSFISRFKWRILCAGSLILLSGGYFIVQNDEGLRRSFQFWTGVLPVYWHYRALQWFSQSWPDEQRDKAFNELHDLYAPKIEKLTLELRGFYLKQAQLMSILDSFVPPQYMKWCKETQDKVPSDFAPGEARRIVEKSMGKNIEDVFKYWEDKPRGSASIGEVHYAILHNGREVAVKVQFPGIERKFRSDLKTLIAFCKFALPQHVPPLLEVELQFLTEFDYVLEAQNLQKIAHNILPTWKQKIAIPRPIMSLCSKNVLIMDYLHGVKLVDGLRNNYRKYAERTGKTLEELEEEQIKLLQSGEVVLQNPTVEKYRIKFFTLAVLMYDCLKNALRIWYNCSFGFFTKKMEIEWTEKPINLAEIMETLYGVHAHEFFLDGEFNGDPHPGNVLLLKDGRLGLIDYGQVKAVPLETRLNYAELVLALAADDKDKIVDVIWNKMNTRGKYARKDVCYRLAVFWNDRFDKDITGGMNMAEFLDWAQAEDPILRVDRDYVMIARVSVLLRGMGNAFGLDLRTTKYFKPYATTLLKQYNLL